MPDSLGTTGFEKSVQYLKAFCGGKWNIKERKKVNGWRARNYALMID